MSSGRIGIRRLQPSASGLKAHSTRAFAALGDHARLPARFFARLNGSELSRSA